MTTGNPAATGRGKVYLEQQLRYIWRLRATGPNPFDYFQWADETSNILRDLYGDPSDALEAFRLAVAESGRTVDQRGVLDNMTLGLHGSWGIWSRLDRGEGVLRKLLGPADETSPPAPSP